MIKIIPFFSVILSLSSAYAQEKSVTNSVAVRETKEDAQVNALIQKQEIAVVDQVLVFKTKDAYQQIVNAPTDAALKSLTRQVSGLKFQNYNAVKLPAVKSASDQKLEVMDEHLGKLLNRDGVIQIGEHAFKIDLLKEMVFVVPAQQLKANYSDLIKGNTKNKAIRVFSTGQDVLDELDGKKGSTEKSCGGIGGGYYPSYPHENQGLIVSQTNTEVVRFNPYVHFFRAGVYFRLSANFDLRRFPSTSEFGTKVTNIGQAFTLEIYVRSPEAWRMRRYCGSGTVGTLSSGLKWTTNSLGEGWSETVYVGANNLNGYYLYIQGRAKLINGAYTPSTPYAGRSINAPYTYP